MIGAVVPIPVASPSGRFSATAPPPAIGPSTVPPPLVTPRAMPAQPMHTPQAVPVPSYTPQAYPVQPMVSQTREVLDRYVEAGGRVREVVLPGVGHSPHLERPAQFRAALLEHLGG